MTPDEMQAEIERLRTENERLLARQKWMRGSEPWPGDDASDAQRLAYAIDACVAEAGLTRRELSQKLGKTDTTVATWISQLRRGRVDVTLGRLRATENALGVEPGHLLVRAKIIAPRVPAVQEVTQ